MSQHFRRLREKLRDVACFGATLVALTLIVTPARAQQTAAPGQATAPAPKLFDGLPPAQPHPQLSLRSDVADWYKDAVVYHLWVASFRDSDGDGVGDLQGIIQGLDTLKELGVTTLWLSPFFKNASTPRNLHGYDVIDHYTVDPRLGTNDDARALVREAHARGLRLVFDFVPNHLSSRHPWFLESRDPNSPKRDWFLWKDQQPEKGWTGFDARSDWHRADSGYYYGIFWGGMPDVNHRNAEVRLEMAKAARHWLDMGFDGLRIDAVRYLYENLSGDGAKADQEDQPETFAWFESFRRDVIDPYAATGYPKFMVAENWTNDRQSLLAYLGRNGKPAFHMTLDFPLLPAFTRLNSEAARGVWEWDATLPAHAWLGNFVSNHDLAADRPGTLFAGKSEKLRAQTAWLLLGPGTPFVYYGNELAQPQGPERGDTKHRKPLDWKEVERQKTEATSVWRWHQQLIRLRTQHPSLRRGKAVFLEAVGAPHVLAMWRSHDGETTLTLFNAGDAVEKLGVVLPAGAPGKTETTPRKWVLGSGNVAVRGDGRLEVGPLGPFETKVLLWSE